MTLLRTTELQLFYFWGTYCDDRTSCLSHLRTFHSHSTVIIGGNLLSSFFSFTFKPEMQLVNNIVLSQFPNSSMSPFFTLFDVLPALTGTIPVLIPCCFYIQNLQSFHEFKYPPSCFNLLMALLKMLLLVCPITYYILVKFHALEVSYRPYKGENL